MMKTWLKRLVFAALLVLGLSVAAAYFFEFLPQQKSLAREKAQAAKADSKLGAAPQSGDTHGSSTAPSSTVSLAASKVIPDKLPASRIYNDSKTDMIDRFHALMDLEYQGDKDARYLAYRMKETCRLAGELSKDKFAPEVWNQGMASALKILKAKCSPLVADPVFQDFSEQVKNLNLYSFSDDIPLHIKQAFANSGAKAAVEAALVAFRRRPDNPTAMMVAETLANLDILAYDSNFQLEGPSALIPAMRKDIFWAALMLYICDLGVPCGPGSDRMLRLRAWSGGQPGQNLHDYFAYTISPQDMRNVESNHEALRRVQPSQSFQ